VAASLCGLFAALLCLAALFVCFLLYVMLFVATCLCGMSIFSEL
jgi:hypothetical protein